MVHQYRPASASATQKSEIVDLSKVQRRYQQLQRRHHHRREMAESRRAPTLTTNGGRQISALGKWSAEPASGRLRGKAVSQIVCQSNGTENNGWVVVEAVSQIVCQSNGTEKSNARAMLEQWQRHVWGVEVLPAANPMVPPLVLVTQS